MVSVIILVAFIGLIILSAFVINQLFKKGIKAQKLIAAQILSFIMIFSVCSVAGVVASAAESYENSVVTTADTNAGDETAKGSTSNDKGLGYIAMAVSVGLGCLGAGIAVAAAAPAAIGATSENPKSFGKSIVFVALAEGVTVFGLLISIFIYGSLT